MKTFIDKLNEADNDIVIKKYNINRTEIYLKKYNFNDALKLSHGESTGFPLQNNLRCDIQKINDYIMMVKITKKCSYECPNCDGNGEHYCDKCECEHECGICYGNGKIYEDEEDELLLEDVIHLNQGVLFE